MPSLARAFSTPRASASSKTRRGYCFTKDTGTWTTAAPPCGAAKLAEFARDFTQSTTEAGKLPVFVALTPDT
jgi:hypothetical protein